jgi:hypothetical protein
VQSQHMFITVTIISTRYFSKTLGRIDDAGY